VEIDGLHPQAAQTFLTLRFDLGGAQSALNARVLEADLRRDEKIPAIAALAHPAPEQGVALPTLAALYPVRVDVGRVEERAARVDVLVEQRVRSALIIARAEIQHAQAQGADIFT